MKLKDHPDAVWHATSRVNWRAWRLSPDAAYRSFVRRLAACLDEFAVDLLAFTVMSNHFHTVVRSPGPETFGKLTSRRTPCRHRRPWPPRHYKSQVISQFMKELKRRVSRDVHQQLELRGHFWERRYHRRLVGDPTDLLFTVAYDHRNPVQAGMTDRPEDYTRSSAAWWSSGAPSEVPLCTRSDFPFGLGMDEFRSRLLLYQCSPLIDEIAAAVEEEGTDVRSATAWPRILDLLGETDLPILRPAAA